MLMCFQGAKTHISSILGNLIVPRKKKKCYILTSLLTLRKCLDPNDFLYARNGEH